MSGFRNWLRIRWVQWLGRNSNVPGCRPTIRPTFVQGVTDVQQRDVVCRLATAVVTATLPTTTAGARRSRSTQSMNPRPPFGVNWISALVGVIHAIVAWHVGQRRLIQPPSADVGRRGGAALRGTGSHRTRRGPPLHRAFPSAVRASTGRRCHPAVRRGRTPVSAMQAPGARRHRLKRIVEPPPTG